jgi:hypothetical protein
MFKKHGLKISPTYTSAVLLFGVLLFCGFPEKVSIVFKKTAAVLRFS